jgi:hypothetical protein
MIYYYTVFLFFAIIAYMIVVDNNVAKYIVLMGQMLIVNIKKWYYIAVFHPGNKLTTWTMNSRIDRMTRQLQKDLDSKKN